MTSVHASCIAIGQLGILIRGAPGSGKSGLCLALMDRPGLGLGHKMLRARLVADDQVILRRSGSAVLASPPPALAGMLEIRGLGLVKLAFRPSVSVRLVVDLVAKAAVNRLPEGADQQVEIAGLALPRVMIEGQSPAAPEIVRAAIFHFGLGRLV